MFEGNKKFSQHLETYLVHQSKSLTDNDQKDYKNILYDEHRHKTFLHMQI